MRPTNRAVFLSCLAASALGAGEAHGYCVYNQSGSKVEIHGLPISSAMESSMFAAKLSPGESACCHWSDQTCNYGGNYKAMLPFTVTYTTYKTVPLVLVPGLPPVDTKVDTGTAKCGRYNASPIPTLYLRANGYMTIQDWNGKTPGKVARVVSWKPDHSYTGIYYCPAD